jgi:hypothetical protein
LHLVERNEKRRDGWENQVAYPCRLIVIIAVITGRELSVKRPQLTADSMKAKLFLRPFHFGGQSQQKQGQPKRTWLLAFQQNGQARQNYATVSILFNANRIVLEEHFSHAATNTPSQS